MTKKIMIEYGSNAYHVTELGLEEVMLLIRKHQACPQCHSQIDSQEHQLVGTKCLACVLEESGLTFVGLSGTDNQGREIYTFMDENGITYTSTANSSDKPYQDVALSIEQYGFTIPTTYKPFKADEAVSLTRHNWEVYGKLTQSVVVIKYHDKWHGKNGLEAVFIAYKGGQTVELNKRSTEHKNLLEKARVLAERTKRGGKYYLPGYDLPRSELHEFHLYPIIATLEAAVWDMQLQFMQNIPPAQEQQELPMNGEPEEQRVQDATQDVIEPVSIASRRRKKETSDDGGEQIEKVTARDQQE